MLTPTQKRYLDISLVKLNDPKVTLEDLARRFGLGLSAISRAIKWGTRYGVFTIGPAVKIKEHLIVARNQLAWLFREKRLAERAARDENGKRLPIPTNHLRVLSQEIREQQRFVAELESVYKQTVNLQLTDGTGRAVTIRYEAVVPETETDEPGGNGQPHDSD